MAGPPLDDGFFPGGHGPSSFGGTGAQFSPAFDDVHDNFIKLEVSDKKKKDITSQASKSGRKASFVISHYEFYVFTKQEDWTVADRVMIRAPQEELERTVARGKKTASVLEAMKKMSQDRRAQIDRLLEEKNHASEDGHAEWTCVFIHSPPSSRAKVVSGRRILEHPKMEIIIARRVPADEGKSSSPKGGKSFVGERSDINEPLKPEGKSKGKDMEKPSKASKEAKGGKDSHEDLFDRVRLFTEDGIPLDENGPVPGFPVPQQLPQHLPFNQGIMGQPFGPPQGQPVDRFQPIPPVQNPVSGNPFPHPAPPTKLPHGIQIIDDQLPPQNGANGVLPAHSRPPHRQANVLPHPPPPHFQHPHMDKFNGAGAGAEARFRQQPNQPIIMQNPPKGRHHHNQRSVHDDSSHESDEGSVFFEDDERSSHTSHGDDHEKFARRGSLAPHRRDSVKKGEKIYREHHRGPSYSIEPLRRNEAPRRESRYKGDRDRVETIVARPSRRRHSSRERREQVQYVQPPRRLEYEPRSPPLTPNSHSSYSPSRRLPSLLFPHEMLDHERDERERQREKQAEEYMHEKAVRDREEAVARRERELIDRELFERSGVRLGRRERELDDRELLERSGVRLGRRERELDDRELLERSGVRLGLGRRMSGHDRYDRYDRYDGLDRFDRLSR